MMKSGYSKNVSNLETIINVLTTLGPAYAPDLERLNVAALRLKYAEARAALDDVDRRQAERAVAANARQVAFRALDRYIANIMRMASITIDDAGFVESLRQAVKRRRQRPATALPGEDGGPAEPVRSARSNGQRSFDDRIEILADIRALLETQAESYRPANADYTLGAVTARVELLRDLNNRAKNSGSLLKAAIEERNRQLFDPANGIGKLVTLIKAHLAVDPGTESAAFREITALRFVFR